MIWYILGGLSVLFVFWLAKDNGNGQEYLEELEAYEEEREEKMGNDAKLT